MSITSGNAQYFTFGRLQWLRRQRVLLKEGRPVRLGSRGREILALLLEKPGALVTTKTIKTQVWHGTIVEEVALRVHIAGLRRILRDGATCHIKNVHGIGYRFIAPSAEILDSTERVWVGPASELIGRSKLIAMVQQRIMHSPLLTLVGPGGIGKSAAARAVASELRKASMVDVEFVDVGGITSTLESNSLIAGVLGKSVGRNKAPASDSDAGAEREYLLVLDNCDQHLEIAARCIGRILSRVPRFHILATSRGALRVKNECVLRLSSLELPMQTQQLSAAEALQFPAIQLFVTRAAACGDGFELTDANATVVARICARLDGVPLALELAAARVHELGLAGLSVSEELLLDLLNRGRRTAAPSHRTLRGMLDCAYRGLPLQLQLALRRLSVFTTEFDRSAAAAVLVDEQLPANRLDHVLVHLAAASAVEARVKTGGLVYRLSNIQRAYALSELRNTPEYAQICRRHAFLSTAVPSCARCEDIERDTAHQAEVSGP